MKRILAILLFPIIVNAQPIIQQRIQDEGGTAIPYTKIDCVGSGITCSASTPNATITVPLPSSLAANGANCSAGNYPLGVDAAGAVESCTVDDDVPEAGDLTAATLDLVTTNGNTTDNQIELLYDITSASPVTGALSNAATVNNDAAPAALAGFNNTLTVGYSAGASTSVPSGLYNRVQFNNPNNSPLVDLTGLNFLTQHSSVATIDDMFGVLGSIGLTGGGTADSGIGVRGGLGMTSGTLASYSDFSSLSIVNGTLTDYYFAKAVAPTVGGTLTNLYGLYIPTWTAGTNNYPVWIEGAGKIHFRESGTTIHSSAASNLDLTATTAVNVNTGSLILPADNQKILVGDTGSRGSIYHNGTDLVINPAEAGTGYVWIGDGSTSPATGKLRAQTIGLGDDAPGNTPLIKASIVSSSVAGGLSATIEHTGTTATMRAMLFEAKHSGSSTTAAKTAVGGNFTASLNVDTSGTVTMLGVNAIAKATVATTVAGNKNFQNQFDVTSTGSSNTAGTIYGRSVWAKEPGTFAGGATVTTWAILSSGLVQINSDKKLLFEGSDTTQGDSYIIFNSASTDIDHYVDATKVVTEDNDLVETFVPFKVAGVTLGAATHIVTTPATSDDPTENVRQNRVATTDATVTTLETLATTTDTSLLADCDIVSRRTGGVAGTAGDVAAYKLYCSAKNVTGTVTEINETEAYTGESQAAWDVDCAVSGTNYLVRVTGAASNDVTWHSTCRTYQVGS